MSRAYRSALVVGISQPVIFTLQLAINVLLARFLTPDDIGLVAMVTSIVNFASIFRELGLGTVTIQREGLTDQQASNLFWLNLLLGIAVALVVCVLAWPISRLYRDPRVVTITLVTASVFVATGLSVQHSALLRRDLRFGVVTGVNIVSLVVSGAAGVLYAYLARSYWSIVVFVVGRQMLTTIGLWLVGGWRPEPYRKGHGTRALLKSGMEVAGFDVINYWSRNLDQILVGRVLGAGVLGIYRKGYEMLLLPVTQVRAPMTAVSLPALSRFQSTPKRLAEVFLDLVSATALLSGSVVAIMLLTAPWLVPLVLGRQWSPIIPVFNGLAIVAVIQSVAGLLGLLLVTTGQTRRYLEWGAWNAAGLVSAFVIGINWRLFGLITCYGAASVLMLVPSVIFCTKHTAVSVRDFMGRALLPNVVTWSVFACALLIKNKLLDAHVSIATASCTTALLFTCLMAIHVVTSRRRYSILVTALARLRSKSRVSSSSLHTTAPLSRDQDPA